MSVYDSHEIDRVAFLVTKEDGTQVLVLQLNDGREVEIAGGGGGGVGTQGPIGPQGPAGIPATSGLVPVKAPETAITVTNLMQDPRATNVGNFAIVLGGGVQVEAPTNQVDGYQQAATPQSCVEIQATNAAGNAVGISTWLKAAATPRTIGFTPGQTVAARVAGKVTAVAGVSAYSGSWYSTLIFNYYNSAGTWLSAVEVAATANNPTLGSWFVLEGFDNQAPATAAYVEVSVLVQPTGGTATFTLRTTEWVVAVDPDGDIPGYVGGDVNGGQWLGTGIADASPSSVNFDPTVCYPIAQSFGLTNWATSSMLNSGAPIEKATQNFTPGQFVGMLREVGSDVARVAVAFEGGNPGPPAISAAGLAYLRQVIASGVKLVLGVGQFPSWMAPTHFGLTQAGNAGAIDAVTTAMNVTGALPTNLALPATFQWNDGSSEVATITALNAGVATIVRGAGAVAHNDGITLSDANFSTAFGHIYYPDPAYRATYGQAVVNAIAALGQANILAVEVFNEPNLNADDTRNEGAAGYSAICNAIYSAVKAANPGVFVTAGVLSCVQAATTGGPTGVTDAVTFLQGMYTAGCNYDWLDCHFYPYPVTIASGASSTGTSGGPSNPFQASFERQIKRMLDTQAAHADNRSIIVSEMGSGALQPTEACQARSDALMLGKFKRMGNIVLVTHNGSAGVSGGSNGPLWNQKNLRPRPVVRQLAKMRGVVLPPGTPPLPGDLIIDPGAISRPADAGVLVQTIDPPSGNVFHPSSGFIYLFKMYVPENITVANLLLWVTTAGAGLTAGNCRAGIYDNQGNLWAQTPDQSAVWNSTGLKKMALAAQPNYSLTLPGGPGVFYWIGILVVGTTTPFFASSPLATIGYHPGYGYPYAALVPGAKHRVGFETVGGRTALVPLTNLTISDNSVLSIVYAGVS